MDTESLSAVSTPALCSFVANLAACVAPSGSSVSSSLPVASENKQAGVGATCSPISLDYLRLEALQDVLAARSMQGLAPQQMVTLVRALADIQQARERATASAARSVGSGKVGSSKAAAAILPALGLPAFRGPLLSAVFRCVKLGWSASVHCLRWHEMFWSSSLLLKKNKERISTQVAKHSDSQLGKRMHTGSKCCCSIPMFRVLS